MKRLAPVLLIARMTLQAQEPVFLKWMDDIAQQQLKQRGEKIAAIKTTAEAETRKKYVRAKILELIGGLPDYNGPLNARVTNVQKQNGYVIEDVIFESLPGLYVTGNVYRPQAAGTYPGI